MPVEISDVFAKNFPQEKTKEPSSEERKTVAKNFEKTALMSEEDLSRRLLSPRSEIMYREMTE